MAVWKGAHPGNFQVGRAGYRPEAIVIHIMDGSLVGTDSWFNDPRAKVAAHYGIGRNGEVHQYVKETDAAYHAGTVVSPVWPSIKRRSQGPGYINPNLYTIGIEHEGKGLNAQQWPQPMHQASLALAADIARRWAIPIDDRHIIPHCAIRSTKPNCPGKGVDLTGYIQDLQAFVPAPSNAPQEQPANFKIRVARAAFVRPQPQTQIAPLRKAFENDEFTAAAIVSGEAVRGNASWFRIGASEYLWAGNTDRPNPA